jgi:CheY-like chemotaxis protein
LLFNVVKHGKVSEAVIKLDRTEDGEVCIVVSDEGAGFDVALRETGGATKGMGLFGLRERIEHLGGSVEIESAPGKGTRVTLCARVGDMPAQIAREARPLAQQGAYRVLTTEPQKIRILIVDDHAMVREGIASILGQTPDIEVVGEAADGEQAIEQAQRQIPDVIVMDVSMPGMSGIEATRIIHEAQPEIRIIGLSMYEEADRAEAMHKAGAAAYLSKGGPAEELLAAIRNGSEK